MALLLTLLLTAQSLAAPGITGVVRDSSGSVVPGATVIARFVNGSEQQTVSGPDGRFSLAVATPGDVVLVVRADSYSVHKRTLAAGRDDRGQRRALAGVPLGNGHRDRLAHGTAAARRAGQRHRAQAGRHPPLAGRRGRRRAAADSDVQPVPAHEQPRVASDRPGRVAARHRPERRQPHARAARQRAVQRSVRRLGVLDAGAARRGRPYRSRGHVELEPLRQLCDGRRHQHHDGRGDAPHGRRQGAVRQPQQPQGGLPGQRRLGQARHGVRRRRVFDGWLSDRRRREPCRRRRTWTCRQERVGGIPHLQPQGRVCRDGQRPRVHARRTLPRGADQRQEEHHRRHRREERHDLDQRERRRPRRDGRRRRARGGALRRLRDLPQQLPRGPGRDPAAQHRPHDAQPARAQHRRRRHGEVVARVQRPAVLQRRHRLALGRRRQRGGRPRRDDGHAGDAEAQLGRHAAQHRPVRPGRHLADGQPDADAQRPAGPVEQLRRAQSRGGLPERSADRQQRPVAARARRHGVQPAHRRALSPHLAAERVGRHRRRLPRADPQRALSPVPRRHGADAGEQSAGAGAA